MPFSLHLSKTHSLLLAGILCGLVALSGGLDSAHAGQPLPEFTRDIEPIFSKRCTVCHGCTEAPCQLKLSSFKGVLRGLSKERVLATPIRARAPMRVKDFIAKGDRDPRFSSILPPVSAVSPNQKLASSILFHSITVGMQNQPGSFQTASLPSHEESQVTCPTTVDEYSQFIAKNPTAGMPLGLPALSQNEYDTLVSWIENGAPGPTASEQAQRLKIKNPAVINKWETFFNRPALRDQLTARYLFEHFSGMRFHFKESPGQYFELVRSRTPGPEPIQEIVTQTNADDPGTSVFFYRLQRFDETPVKKNHIVFETDLGEIDRLEKLFSSVPWNISKLPAHTANPFQDFAEMPTLIRARFMQTHSHLMIDQMVRGTVCIGSAATFAIRDHFWVMFLKPESDPSVVNPKLGLHRWITRKSHEGISTDFTEVSNYQDAFEHELRKIRPNGLGIDDIWTGDGRDANTRITVFRHENIASAHQGWIGGRPLTAWVLSYSNFERLYYNLVTNYKYWGSLIHRARTWDVMRTIRQEGEELFISLLPKHQRSAVRDQWTSPYSFERLKTTTANEKSLSQVDVYAERSESRDSRVIVTNIKDPVGDVLSQIDRALPPNFSHDDDSLNQSIDIRSPRSPTLPGNVREATTLSFQDFEKGLRSLTNRSDFAFPHVLPSMTVVRALDPIRGETRVYTILANRAYLGHPSPLNEMRERLKEKDNISAFPGIVGSHPNLYVDLNLRDNGSSFLFDLMNLQDGQIDSFKAKYGIGRNSEKFWPFNDWINDWYLKADKVHGARLDLNHYDNGQGYL